jgi:MinD-like ATPase involved in chromosome partitioning or flagellar assembly
VPPAWIDRAVEGRALLRWVLLFSSTDRMELLETYGIAKRVLGTSHEARLGVTIHGARRVAEAQRAFLHLSGVAARHLGRELASYGVLLDDLHIYRAIVSRRPIGLEHPQSRAARALRDVARLLLEDARKAALA